MGKYKQHAHSLEKVLQLYLRQPLQLWSHPSHNHLRYDQEIIVILFDRESFDQEIASLQLSNTKFMPETAKEEIYIYFTTIGKTVCSTQHMLYSDYFYRLRKDDDMIIYLVIHDFSK